MLGVQYFFLPLCCRYFICNVSATYLQRYLQRYNCLSVSLLFRFCCRWQMFFYFSNFIV